ncbi:MAG TPA: hypothetical protein VL330_27970 [Actinomycetes bacterium]|nr:hypothetical protein [Actinomycetes bacterium]
MSATTAMFMLAGIWIGFGLLLALIMGRHGHDPFAWWLLGTLLGPLAVPLAVSSEGRQAERPERLRACSPSACSPASGAGWRRWTGVGGAAADRPRQLVRWP